MLMDLSLADLKQKSKLYLVYVCSQILIFSLFFAIQCFGNDSVIVTRLADNANIKEMARLISVFYTIFVLFYFIYFNNFFMRQKSEELGIYSILGFSDRKLINLFWLENTILILIGVILAVPLGLGIYALIRTWLIKFLGLDIAVWPIAIGLKAYFSLGSLGMITVIITYLELVWILKKNLVEIVNLQVIQDKKIKKRPVIAWVGITTLLIAYGLLIDLSQRPNDIWDKVGFMPIAALTAILLIGGTVLTINYSLPQLIDYLLKNKQVSYGQKNNVVLPRMQHRIRNKSQLITVIGLLFSLSVVTLGITAITLSYPKEAMKRVMPATLETILAKKKALSPSQTESIKKHFPAATVTDVEIVRVPIKEQLAITNKLIYQHLDAISLTEYNSLAIAEGKTKLKQVPVGQGVLVNYYASLNHRVDKRVNSTKGDQIYLKNSTNNNVIAFGNSVAIVVLNDGLFTNLQKKYADSNFYLTSINGKNMRDNMAIPKYFDHLQLKYLSSAKRNKEIVTANSPTFLLISIATVLFFISISTILYFTAKLEVAPVLSEYQTLIQLGYGKREIIKVVMLEISWLFVPTLVLGLISGFLGIYGASYMIMDTVTKSNWQIIFGTMRFVLYVTIPVYLCVYLLACRSVFGDIRRFVGKVLI